MAGQACFFVDFHRERHLQGLREIVLREGCAVHARMRMSNHVHPANGRGFAHESETHRHMDRKTDGRSPSRFFSVDAVAAWGRRVSVGSAGSAKELIDTAAAA